MSQSPTSLLLFTTSQSPLAIRFPRPHKPLLNLPALVHRTLHTSFDASPASFALEGSTLIVPHPDTLVKHDVPAPISSTSDSATEAKVNGTSTADDTGVTTSEDALAAEETSQPPASHSGPIRRNAELDAEITLKLHLVAPAPPSTRLTWVRDALRIVRERKGLMDVDTILIGFGGVDYRGKRSKAAEFFGCGAEGLTSDPPSAPLDHAALREIREVWEGVVGDKGLVGQSSLGTLYLPLDVLRALGEEGAVKVNSLDTPDCHSLPKEYTEYAREKGIELWAGGGGEGSDPMPDADLHNLLQEFHSALPAGDQATSPLETPIPLRADGLKYDGGVKRGVQVKWVLTYTLVSKTRNVLEDKGFIIAADILP